ncbi:MAG: hypothetical protein HFJ33_08135 [Clostridia bacterium]|uniref:hypothetical protein n=1 Tax=Thomasclavelia cocleata TaxID=69824 RepID=UPI00272E4FFA|nr:hypothetical protein [Thomasclavelia cocleata]MCI8384799.1 hypothetical protein [Clostridia bacterium]
MKRCKWLIDWFDVWIRQFEWEQIVGFAISGLVGIALTIMMFVYTDKVPATPSDYEQLEDQVNVIQQNPYSLLETDCNIKINGEIITIEFENDECKMTAKYDKNFEVLSTSKEDKSMFWLWALVLSLIVGGVEINFVGWLLSLVILSLKIVVEWIVKRVKKL